MRSGRCERLKKNKKKQSLKWQKIKIKNVHVHVGVRAQPYMGACAHEWNAEGSIAKGFVGARLSKAATRTTTTKGPVEAPGLAHLASEYINGAATEPRRLSLPPVNLHLQCPPSPPPPSLFSSLFWGGGSLEAPPPPPLLRSYYISWSSYPPPTPTPTTSPSPS